MRCGIYGGSFNPIHNGHLELSRSLLREGLVDEVWLMVSPLNPFKQGSRELLPDGERLRLAQLAVEGEPRIRVSDFETRLPQPSYMSVTLQRLRESFPKHEFTLVIGADNWLRFPDWHKSEEILSRHHIIICPRPGFEVTARELPSNVSLAPTPLLPISSSNIRQRIRQASYNGEELPESVWREIRTKHYYLS